MTQESKEKSTPLKNIEEQEKLKVKYEDDVKEAQEKITTLENTITKKNDEIFELQKSNKSLSTERDDWKKEAHSARRVQQESKVHKETNDFLTEFKRLQEKKGLQWDENQETWVNINN